MTIDGIELGTLTLDDEWGETAFRDAGAATFGDSREESPIAPDRNCVADLDVERYR